MVGFWFLVSTHHGPRGMETTVALHTVGASQVLPYFFGHQGPMIGTIRDQPNLGISILDRNRSVSEFSKVRKAKQPEKSEEGSWSQA